MPKISVLMAVHNGLPYLQAAIESVLAQTYTDFEFLIADDASSDGSTSVVEGYALNDQRIQLVRLDENVGLVQALNLLLTMANGEFIARMDADDVCCESRLRHQVDVMINNRDLVLLGTAFEYIDGKGCTFAAGNPPTTNTALQDYLIGTGNPFCHPSVLMRTAMVKGLGGYRQVLNRYAQDYDLFLRLAEQGEIGNLKESLMKYRVHAGQITVQKMRPQLQAAFIYQELARQRRNSRAEDIDEAQQLTDQRKPELDDAVVNGSIYWAKLLQRQGNRKAARNLSWNAVSTRPWNRTALQAHLSILIASIRGWYVHVFH